MLFSLLKTALSRPSPSPVLKNLGVHAFLAVRTASIMPPPKFKPVRETEDTDTGALSLRVISYNILAQVYTKSIMFPYSPKPCLRWKARGRNILEELRSFEADVLCLQELDEFEEYYRAAMERSGYDSLYRQRPGKKRDGCGIFFKASRLDMLKRKDIDYNDVIPPEEMAKIKSLKDDDPEARNVSNPWVRLKRDCVGVMGAFAWKGSTDVAFVAACTHLFWDPELADVKLAQARHLVSSLEDFQHQLGATSARPIPVIVGGDFNSQPGDKVYRFLCGEEDVDSSQGEVDKRDGSSPLRSKGPGAAETAERVTIPRLHSAYACQGAEPPFTNYTPGFTGTLDYIWLWPPARLRVNSLLEIPGPDAPSIKGGLPNLSHASDHLPLGAELQLID
eukprot:TRINITY_DN1753_c1_g1_i1.p1 TRINITY_DN1753_c1_g1~~TRINITY_DN1753_c1_g1_i1.p1  ORF type:complete len:392 (-),score=44.80 TRINITY_DN1753_c1_g1_i1:60-1235(-)